MARRADAVAKVRRHVPVARFDWGLKAARCRCCAAFRSGGSITQTSGTIYAIVNVEQLNEFDNGATVTPEALVEAGLADRLFDGIKVLGNGALKKKLTVKAQRFSASAREKITQAGGQCEDLPLRSIHHKPAPPPGRNAESGSGREVARDR